MNLIIWLVESHVIWILLFMAGIGVLVWFLFIVSLVGGTCGSCGGNLVKKDKNHYECLKCGRIFRAQKAEDLGDQFYSLPDSFKYRFQDNGPNRKED